MSEKTTIKWTNEMHDYLFKRLFQLMGPAETYVKPDKSHIKKETEAFEIIAKELTLHFKQQVTTDKVMMNVYSTAMAPALNPREAHVMRLAAAFSSGWLTNRYINIAEKHYRKKNLMIDVGNYYLIKKS